MVCDARSGKIRGKRKGLGCGSSPVSGSLKSLIKLLEESSRSARREAFLIGGAFGPLTSEFGRIWIELYDIRSFCKDRFDFGRLASIRS